MEEDFIIDPVKSYKPKQPVIAASAGISSSDTPDLTRLEKMSREELIALVRRYACQCGTASLMTKEETAQAMRDVLAETALKPIIAGGNIKADIQARMSAIDKWLDRTEGKSIERIEATVAHKNEGTVLILTDLQAELDTWRKKQHMVIEQTTA